MDNNIIVYRRLESPLGDILAGSTEKGCCFLMFEDSISFTNFKQKVERKYQRELIKGDNAILDQLEIELKEYFDCKRKDFSIPIDVKGTQFQENVWKELMSIPFGETSTYNELAKKIEKPNSSRAVGNANGSNLISIIVPCHRVVHKAKNRMGYAGGIERKKYLLNLESNVLEDKI